MAVKYLPVLGPLGWVTDGRTMLDTVTSWLYASDNSQSYFFNGDISSIAYVLEKNAGNLEKARGELEEMLTRYYSRFFDQVEVEVRTVERQFKDYHLLGELMIGASMIDHTGEILQLNEVMTNKGSASRTVLDFNPYLI